MYAQQWELREADREHRRHPQHAYCFHRSLPKKRLLFVRRRSARPEIASLGCPPHP
jgi:hypothetical protein